MALLCEAQNSSNCLTVDDLKRYQNSSLNSINSDLISKSWTTESDVIDETKYYFDYKLGFSVKKWQNKSTPYFVGILSLYYKKDIPNLIVYQTTNSCFIEQLGNNSLSINYPDYKSYITRENSKLIEFREYSDATLKSRFLILVYNESSLNDLKRIEKYGIEINIGDNYYQQLKFVQAIESYNKVLNLLIHSEGEIITEVREKIRNCERRLNIDKTISEGDLFYESRDFPSALNRYENVKKLIFENESDIKNKIEIKITNSKNNITQIETNNIIALLTTSADSLFNTKEFKKSKDKYQNAKDLAGNLNPQDSSLIKRLELKIISCENLILLTELLNQLNEIDKAFSKAHELQKNRKYDDAIQEFNKVDIDYKGIQSVYKLNPSIKNENLGLRIEKSIESTKLQINKLKDLQTISSYANINRNDYLIFRNKNYNFLNTIVNSQKSGFLKYDAIIEFDDFGINKSRLNINSFSSKNIQSSLVRAVDFSELTPSQKLDYFVPSHEGISFDLKWATSIYIANSKRSEINITPFSSGKYEIYQIENFVKKQNFKRGVFKFEVAEKQLNETNYTDIKLLNYRNNAGPSKVINSIIWPGWGRYKVTNGEKGQGRALFFLIASGLTIGSKYYSDIQYNKYANTNDPFLADQYYQNADISNKVFLVSGGIAAFTYIQEFFWVIGKGLRNNKQTRGLEEKLKNGPVKISDSPLKPE